MRKRLFQYFSILVVSFLSQALSNDLCTQLGPSSVLCAAASQQEQLVAQRNMTDAPTADQVILTAIAQDTALTVVNSQGAQVRLTNSNQWESFANQQYLAGGNPLYTVTNSAGQSFIISSFDVVAYGEAARATRGTQTIPIAEQERNSQITYALFEGTAENQTVFDDYIDENVFTNPANLDASNRPWEMDVEHIIASNALAIEKISNSSLDADLKQQWINSLDASTTLGGGDGDVLTDVESYNTLISAIGSGSSTAIDNALNGVLQDYVENSTYIQTFGSSASSVAEGLYLYPVALQQAIDEYEDLNGALTPAQIDAIRLALENRFLEAGFDAEQSSAMAVNTLGQMGLLYTTDVEALGNLVAESIAANYGLDVDDVRGWFVGVSAEDWALLSNALLAGDTQFIRDLISRVAVTNNVDLETIDRITNNLSTAINSADITIGNVSSLIGQPGSGTIGEIVNTAVGSMAQGARSWLDFELNFTPNWDDLMVQALYRSIGQPIAYVFQNLMGGTLPDSAIANPNGAMTPLVTVFQFGAAMGMIILGGLFLYTMVVGLYKTAQTGSFLGENVSSAMYPIRAIYGALLMAPIPGAGGLTVATLLLMAFSLIGIALAGSLAVAGTTAALQSPLIVFDRKVDPSIGSNVLKSMTCLYTLKDQGRLLGDEEQGPMAWTAQAEPRNLYSGIESDYNALLDVRPNIFVRAGTAILSFFNTSSNEWSDPLDSQNSALQQSYLNEMRSKYEDEVGGKGAMLQRIHFGSGGRCGEVVITAGHHEGAADDIIEAYNELVAQAEATDTNARPNLKAVARIVSNNSLESYKIALGEDDPARARELDTVLLTDNVQDGEPLPFLMSRSAQDSEDDFQAQHEAWKRRIKHLFYTEHARIYRQHFIDRNPNALDFWDVACLIVEGEDCYREGGYGSSAPAFIQGATPALVQTEIYRIVESYYTDLELALNQILTNPDNFDESNSEFITHMTNMGFVSLGIAPWMIELRQKQYQDFFNFSTLEGYEGFKTQRVLDFGDDKRVAINFDGRSGDADQQQFSDNLAAAEFSAGEPLTKRLRDDLESMALNNSVNEGSQNVSQWIARTIGGSILNIIGDINDTNAMPISRLRMTGDAMQTSALLFRSTAAAVKALPKGFEEGRLGKAASLLTFNPFPVVSEIIAANIEPFMSIAGHFDLIAFVLSNIVPLLPTILFFLSLIGLLGYYFESYFAVNLGVAMKAHHEGDDFIGKGGKIYPLILTVTLRAPFIVVGFWLGTVIHAVGFNMLNGLLLPAATVANSSAEGWNFANLTSWLGVIVAWAAVQVALAYKSYGMVIEFPNAAFRWLGVMDHQDLGEREGATHVTGILSRGQGYLTKAAGAPGGKGKGGSEGGKGKGGSEGGDTPTGGDTPKRDND